MYNCNYMYCTLSLFIFYNMYPGNVHIYIYHQENVC